VAENAPPGRARRLWLVNRLAWARRSLELLDRKRHILLGEHDRLEARRDQIAKEWAEACTKARRDGLRAAALGGASDVALAAAPVTGRAIVEMAWAYTAGVRHPVIARCDPPELPPEYAATVNSAVAPAAASYRQAVIAAAAHAAADASFRIIQAELAATERRHRAIERYRIPDLENELRVLLLRLDELEREERVVTRWADRRRHDRSSP
jgi:vacuolar-type H+-ATPase subunit D/Vma8